MKYFVLTIKKASSVRMFRDLFVKSRMIVTAAFSLFVIACSTQSYALSHLNITTCFLPHTQCLERFHVLMRQSRELSDASGDVRQNHIV